MVIAARYLSADDVFLQKPSPGRIKIRKIGRRNNLKVFRVMQEGINRIVNIV